jgi:aminomethyltransferase
MLEKTVTPRFIRESQRVYHPGITALPTGTERYEVAGAGLLVLRLFSGDTLRLVDVEGGQPAEIVPFRPQGDCDSGLLDTAANGRAEGLKKMLAYGNRLQTVLDKTGINLNSAVSIDCFGKESPAGVEAVFVASNDAFVVIAAPGDNMIVDESHPPTPLLAFVERAHTAAENISPPLPEPLAEPKLDCRVHSATAKAYRVNAGDWIQLIDVEGRQCADFQAFSLAALEKGKERCLDLTVSRTLMRRAYPTPGVHAKYYDYNFEPLVEIVQDTCNRHDAFGIACCAKYYEDMGYPGHVNCSDNFNTELEPYGVEPRQGWMAMNFFFNTNIDCGENFCSDEPWSRPGDYVLLRALTDLVCVSSACPDDIDPANGWNPTDIHLRTYDKSLRARRSVWFRKRPDSEAEMTKETGFHPRTAALTREFVESNGYWLPAGFSARGALDEYWACREKAVAVDLSVLRKFEIVGPDAEALLQYCLTRNMRRLAVGQVVYTAMCYDTGTMIDDGTVFRLGDDVFRWVGGNDYGGEWLI